MHSCILYLVPQSTPGLARAGLGVQKSAAADESCQATTKHFATVSRPKGANHDPFHGVPSGQRIQSGSQHREGVMSKSASAKWLLSPEWGVGTDPYNFIPYCRRGKRWDAVGFYPSPDLLLKSYYRKITRTEPAGPDLVRHVEAISRRVQGWAARLNKQLIPCSQLGINQGLPEGRQQRLQTCSCDRSDGLKADDNENCL